MKFYRTYTYGKPPAYLEALYEASDGSEYLFIAHDPPDLSPMGYAEVRHNTKEYKDFTYPWQSAAYEELESEDVPTAFREWVESQVKEIEGGE